jgi:hypothetical protein
LPLRGGRARAGGRFSHLTIMFAPPRNVALLSYGSMFGVGGHLRIRLSPTPRRSWPSLPRVFRRFSALAGSGGQLAEPYNGIPDIAADADSGLGL